MVLRVRLEMLLNPIVLLSWRERGRGNELMSFPRNTSDQLDRLNFT